MSKRILIVYFSFGCCCLLHNTIPSDALKDCSNDLLGLMPKTVVLHLTSSIRCGVGEKDSTRPVQEPIAWIESGHWWLISAQLFPSWSLQGTRLPARANIVAVLGSPAGEQGPLPNMYAF